MVNLLWVGGACMPFCDVKNYCVLTVVKPSDYVWFAYTYLLADACRYVCLCCSLCYHVLL